MNYSAACESARNSPRKTLANPRVSRNSPPTTGIHPIPRSRNTLLGKCDAFCIWMPATWNYPAVSLPFFERLLPFHAPGNFGEDRFSPGAEYVRAFQEMWRNFVYKDRCTQREIQHVKKIFNIFWWRIFRDVEEVCLLIVIEIRE